MLKAKGQELKNPLIVRAMLPFGTDKVFAPSVAYAVAVSGICFLILTILTIMLSIDYGYNLLLQLTSREFATSFNSSLWASLIVFLFLGITTLVFFSTDPRTHDMYLRIAYIFASNEKDIGVLKKLESTFEEYAAFGKESSQDIVLRELREANSGLKLEIRHQCKICNLFHDRPYQKKSKVVILPDELENFAGDNYGELTFLFLTNSSTGKKQIDWGQTQSITQPLAYTKEYPLDIEPNKSVSLDQSWWYWSKLGVEQTFKVQRLTKEHVYRFSNSTTRRIRVSCDRGRMSQMDCAILVATQPDESFFLEPGTKDLSAVKIQHFDPSQAAVFRFTIA